MGKRILRRISTRILFLSFTVLVVAGTAVAVLGGMFWGPGMWVRADSAVPDDGGYVRHVLPEFSFEYPSMWFVADTPVEVRSFVVTSVSSYDEKLYNASTYGAAGGNLSKITVAKVPKDPHTSFTDWLAQYVARGQEDWGTEVLREERVTIDGRDAVLHIEQLGILPSPVAYINGGDAVYIIIGGAFNEALDEVFYRLVGSFRFNEL